MSVERVDGVDGPGEAAFEVVDRRRLMLGGLAAVAGAGVVASVAEPASAANGDPVILGQVNTATDTTQVTTSTSGTYALKGVQTAETGSGAGVWGQASKGTGVYGSTNGATYAAVLGRNTSTGWGVGVRGITTRGYGVRGESADPAGAGLAGLNSAGGTSVYAAGVYGSAATNYGSGVAGTTDAAAGYGVSGHAYGNSGIGVYGYSVGQAGVWGQAPPPGYALYGFGNAHVTGHMTVVGSMSKGGGSFKIDHPLDPANKYLYHSFVESPDMKNVYDGVVELDDDGTATVEMPDWFEALNRDFRYQLTPFGAAPNLNVSSKMKDGKFSIAGGAPGQEVSWQVTGIRQDAWANANRIPVEQDKTKSERGKYLHAELVKGGKPLFKAPKAPKQAKAPKMPVNVPVQ